MRCKFCGWANPDYINQCQKCGNPIGDGTEANLLYEQDDDGDEKKTVAFRKGHRGTLGEKCRCPNCSYPLLRGMTVCPQCKYELSTDDFAVPVLDDETPAEPTADSTSGRKDEAVDKRTYNPYLHPHLKETSVPGFSLTPVARDGDDTEAKACVFEGDTIVLNRQNTDPGNSSITGKEQASVTYEGGEWFVVDKSSQKTTFVSASRKTRLQDGDVILLGNRMFVFKESK